MIYRMEVLTNDDRFELWAHNPEEAKAKFTAQYPDTDFELFPYGNAPQYLNLSHVRKIQALTPNDPHDKVVWQRIAIMDELAAEWLHDLDI